MPITGYVPSLDTIPGPYRDSLLPARKRDAPQEVQASYPYRISVPLLALYLEIYHHKLYPVWPIVDKQGLITKLEDIPDTETYILASSVCVASILQLQLSATDITGRELDPEIVIGEIESLRSSLNYRESLSLDTLSVSFFLHVAHLHMKRQGTSTLLLRESISMAHMLGLHKPAHYTGLSHSQTSTDLRVIWLLYITEQAHALQYDLPCTLDVPSNLPELQADAEPFTLTAFASLCSMFKALSEASTSSKQTAEALSLIHLKLQQLPTPAEPYNQLQKADVGVTQHWTRLQLWKLAVSRIKMTSEPSGEVTSLLFPLRVTKDLLSEVSAISVDNLEAHGSGMELKLFEFVNAIADLMVCMPHRWAQGTAFGPREYLMHLGKVLGGFRGGNEALLPLLRSRFTELGLALPAVPRLLEVNQNSSDSSPGRFVDVDEEATGQGYGIFE